MDQSECRLTREPRTVAAEQIDRLAAAIRKEKAAGRMLEALKRAADMLKATQDFIETNPVKDYMVHYDEADCDAECLREDCRIAEEECRTAIAVLEGK